MTTCFRKSSSGFGTASTTTRAEVPRRLIRELYDRISRLDLIDRSLILLWLEGISYDEIGAIIGITPNNVGVRLARIKDKLVRMSKNE